MSRSLPARAYSCTERQKGSAIGPPSDRADDLGEGAAADVRPHNDFSAKLPGDLLLNGTYIAAHGRPRRDSVTTGLDSCGPGGTAEVPGLSAQNPYSWARVPGAIGRQPSELTSARDRGEGAVLGRKGGLGGGRGRG